MHPRRFTQVIRLELRRQLLRQSVSPRDSPSQALRQTVAIITRARLSKRRLATPPSSPRCRCRPARASLRVWLRWSSSQACSFSKRKCLQRLKENSKQFSDKKLLLVPSSAALRNPRRQMTNRITDPMFITTTVARSQELTCQLKGILKREVSLLYPRQHQRKQLRMPC